MLKLVIFDCDGVMFDSKETNRAYYNQLLNHFSCPPMNEDEVAYVHVHNVFDSVDHIFRNHSHVAMDSMAAKEPYLSSEGDVADAAVGGIATRTATTRIGEKHTRRNFRLPWVSERVERRRMGSLIVAWLRTESMLPSYDPAAPVTRTACCCEAVRFGVSITFSILGLKSENS